MSSEWTENYARQHGRVSKLQFQQLSKVRLCDTQHYRTLVTLAHHIAHKHLNIREPWISESLLGKQLDFWESQSSLRQRVSWNEKCHNTEEIVLVLMTLET